MKESDKIDNLNNIAKKYNIKGLLGTQKRQQQQQQQLKSFKWGEMHGINDFLRPGLCFVLINFLFVSRAFGSHRNEAFFC